MAIHVRKIARRSWILVLRVLALLFIIVGISVGLLLGTEAGRISLAHQAVKLYSLYSNDDLKVGGLATASPGQWSIRTATWSPSDSGLAVSVQNLSLQWQWRFAVNNRWWLPEVSIARLEVTLPSTQSAEASSQGIQDYANVWQAIPAVRIEQLLVDRLVVNRPHYPSLNVSLNAQADINWGVVPARFIVSISDAESPNELALQLNAEGVDQVRAKGAINAWALSSWTQWLNWGLEQNLTANWDLLVDYSVENQLTIDIGESSLPWQDHQLGALGRVVYLLNEQQFNFEQLGLRLDEQPASINGWINRSESELDINVDHWNLKPLLQYLGVESAEGDINGRLQWFGGWRTPRVNGQVELEGRWKGIPINSQLVSEATSSGLRIEQADVIAGKNSISLQGDIDWRDDDVALSYQTNIKRGPFINQFVSKLPKAIDFNGDLEGVVSGKVFEPTIEFSGKTSLSYLGENYQAALSGRISQEGLEVDRYALFGDLAHFNGQGRVSFLDQQWQSQLSIVEIDSQLLDLIAIKLPVEWHGVLSGQFKAVSDADSFNIEGNASILGLYQQAPMNAQLTISQLNPQSLALSQLAVRIGDTFVQGQGRVNWADPEWDFDLEHSDFAVELIQPWLPQWPDLLSTFKAKLTGRTRLSNVWSQPIIETDSALKGQWFGQPLSAQVLLEPNTLNDWRLTLEKGVWYGGQISYEGQLDAYNLQLQGHAQLQQWPLSNFVLFNQNVVGRTTQMPQDLSGMLNAEVDIDGTISAFNLQGEVGFEGAFQNQPLKTSVEFSTLNQDEIVIDILSSEWGNNQAKLSGYYDYRRAQYELLLDAQMNQVEPLAGLIAPFIVNETVRTSLQSWTGQLNTSLLAKNDQGETYIEGELNSRGLFFEADYDIQWQGKGSWHDILNQQFKATWGDSTISEK